MFNFTAPTPARRRAAGATPVGERTSTLGEDPWVHSFVFGICALPSSRHRASGFALLASADKSRAPWNDENYFLLEIGT